MGRTSKSTPVTGSERAPLAPGGPGLAGGDALVLAEKLLDLNMINIKVARSILADNVRALVEAKDAQEFASLRQSLAQPTIEKAAAYSRALYELSAETQAEMQKFVETHMAEAKKSYSEVMDKLVISAPIGSEAAQAAVKSWMAAVNNAYENMTKAAEQVPLRSREEPELQAIVTLATAGTVPKTLARIVESLAQTYLALDRAQRETVDAIDDNAEAALYLLARVDTKHSDSSVSDAIAAFDARTALERLAGGLIRPTELAERTGWSRQSILDWSNANRLLAVEDNGRRKYPQCQFDDKGNILPGLDHVLGALASNGVRGWMALDFLFSVDPATGETPIALLRSGRIDEAVHSAKIFGEEGAA